MLLGTYDSMILLEHLHHGLLARPGKDPRPDWCFESPLFYNRCFQLFIAESFVNTYLEHVETKNVKLFL